MPLFTSLSALSQTAASNAPDGSVDAPSSIDDQLRLLGSFIATLRDGKGQSAEVDVASGATCDIGGANTSFVRITGTTGITSFGTNYNGPRFIRFAGALTLTHNATSLVLPGAANITTAAGDSCIAVPISGGWVVTQYQRANAQPMTQSAVASGYVKLPGGLTLQWGVSSNITGGSNALVTYPTAFTTQAFSVTANAVTTLDGTAPITGLIELVSASQFRLHNYASGGSSAAFYWIAIGL